MEYLQKVKIKLADYSDIPINVKPSLPKSIKTLKNARKYIVNPILKDILKNPTADIYDIDPSELIIKADNENYKITISLNKREIIDNYDKFEILADGRVKKIDVIKEVVKKPIKEKTNKEPEKEMEEDLEISFNKKTPKFPQIKR